MKVGLIGAGAIAGHHMKALRRLPGAEVAAILDTKPGAAQKLASLAGVPRHFQDPIRFYEEIRPEIVHVLTPPATHHEVTMEALRRGIHVLVEKPMALTVQECHAMEGAAETAGVTVGVDHTLVFDPRVRAAKRRIMERAIGDLVHVETIFGFDVRRSPHMQPGGGTGWIRDLPGGLLEDLLPHPLSVTLDFLGPGATPAGWDLGRSGRIPGDSADELRLSMRNDRTTAGITLSLSIHPDLFTVTLYGSRGTIRVDVPSMIVLRSRLRSLPKPVARGILVAESSLIGLLKTGWNIVAMALGAASPPGDVGPLLRAHYAALEKGEEVPVGIPEGLPVVEIIRQIWPA